MQAHGPDILLISARLHEKSAAGLELMASLRESFPELKIVALLESPTRDVVVQAFRLGARGVFSKNAPLKTLGKCISCVFEGQVWATAEELGFVLEALAATPSIRPLGSVGLSQLSVREMEVVNCLAEGLSNREIAQRLKLSRHTIKNYMFRIFDKVGVSSRVELLFYALSRPAGESGSVPPQQNGPATNEVVGESMAEPQSNAGRRELRAQLIGRRRGDRSLTSPKVETARDRRPGLLSRLASA
jgi:DNA-binding NarL/FixJ family response regulator